jgi:hypothetical protein
MVGRIFYIDDFSVRSQRKNPQYEVLYEDLGLDEVQTFDPETLLEILTENKTELVTIHSQGLIGLNFESFVVGRPYSSCRTRSRAN